MTAEQKVVFIAKTNGYLALKLLLERNAAPCTTDRGMLSEVDRSDLEVLCECIHEEIK